MEIKRKKMGTVEPEYFGGVLDNENTLAFIAGAIKKYGADPAYGSELVDYILNLLKYVKRKS